jgi:hypothetical protein
VLELLSRAISHDHPWREEQVYIYIMTDRATDVQWKFSRQGNTRKQQNWGISLVRMGIRGARIGIAGIIVIEMYQIHYPSSSMLYQNQKGKTLRAQQTDMQNVEILLPVNFELQNRNIVIWVNL